jgi:hypothetical protein
MHLEKNSQCFYCDHRITVRIRARREFGTSSGALAVISCPRVAVRRFTGIGGCHHPVTVRWQRRNLNKPQPTRPKNPQPSGDRQGAKTPTPNAHECRQGAMHLNGNPASRCHVRVPCTLMRIPALRCHAPLEEFPVFLLRLAHHCARRCTPRVWNFFRGVGSHVLPASCRLAVHKACGEFQYPGHGAFPCCHRRT